MQERAQVKRDGGTLNLREFAGTQYPILLRLEPLAVFTVISNPLCAEGFFWYEVRYNDVVGWIAEGDADRYYASPYLEG